MDKGPEQIFLEQRQIIPEGVKRYTTSLIIGKIKSESQRDIMSLVKKTILKNKKKIYALQKQVKMVTLTLCW